MSSNMQQPILQRSTPYAYEKLAEKNESIRSSISLFASSVGSSGAKKNGVTADEEFTLGSISSVLLSIENPSLSASDDECSYSYSAESVESYRHKQKFHGGRLGATPSSEKREEFNSLSPVKRREDNVTLDIPGCSDWSFDISRMSMPAVASERGGGGEEAIAQDANFVAVDTRDDSLAITFSAQLESLALRLASLEKAIGRCENHPLPSGDQNMAFIVESSSVEEEDSIVVSLTNGISEEISDADARKGRRAKQSCFLRLFFFGGCRKL